MDRGPQFPESAEPARNFDQEHYQGHHHRLLLGYQQQCDMCRTINRNNTRDSQALQQSRNEMESAGVDVNDRDAVNEYHRKKNEETTNKERMRRERGEETPNTRPSIGHTPDNQDPRSNGYGDHSG